jgi:pyruvyltransferase
VEIIYKDDKDKLLINPDGNWGDNIGYLVLKHFSNSSKLKYEDIFHCAYYRDNLNSVRKNGKILSVGSIMQTTLSKDIIWGSGCLSPESIGEIPKKVYAVRGPLTRKALIDRGIECPEVYGDPALLFPKIYNPKIEKKYEYGIIPHYIDYANKEHLKLIYYLGLQGVKIINITTNPFTFIDELLSVKKVLSSSLHGLIAADAYKIPNAKINLSVLVGNEFKFMDYFLSVKRKPYFKTFINNTPSISNLDLIEYNNTIDFDSDALLKAGPWNDPNCKFF